MIQRAQGAVRALYYAERLYQFPLGSSGCPWHGSSAPSRHAARIDQPRFSRT